jgi:N-acetylglutamate synthase-like GNAT family acetyltransferase
MTDAKPLTPDTLRRLTNSAMLTFLGEGAGFEAHSRPGIHVVLSNEPIADMNMIVVGGAADTTQLRGFISDCLQRDLPFLVMFFPDAPQPLQDVAAELGLQYAVDFPMMVRDDLPLEPSGNPDVAVSRASGEQDASDSADILVSAYSMNKDSVLRSNPASLFDTPELDVFIARINGETVGSVTLTYHGETCGIWGMGTDASKQRGGIGLRLLSTAMCEARKSGARRFFLGSTPAGYRLYETLGYRDVCNAAVWVSGVTHQA